MADKVLNTRIKLKIDSYLNWELNNTVLFNGEVAVVTIPQNYDGDNTLYPPAVLFKVGDGEHTYNELDFTQSIAADVYDWAKKSTPDYDDFKDIDTNYRLVIDNTGKVCLEHKHPNEENWNLDGVNTFEFSTNPDNVNISNLKFDYKGLDPNSNNKSTYSVYLDGIINNIEDNTDEKYIPNVHAVKSYIGKLNKFHYIRSTNPLNTPIGVAWYNKDTGDIVIGELEPSESTIGKIYLVPMSTDDSNDNPSDFYDEYFTFYYDETEDSDDNGSYYWEKIGNTELVLDLDGTADATLDDTITDDSYDSSDDLSDQEFGVLSKVVETNGIVKSVGDDSTKVMLKRLAKTANASDLKIRTGLVLSKVLPNVISEINKLVDSDYVNNHFLKGLLTNNGTENIFLVDYIKYLDFKDVKLSIDENIDQGKENGYYVTDIEADLSTGYLLGKIINNGKSIYLPTPNVSGTLALISDIENLDVNDLPLVELNNDIITFKTIKEVDGKISNGNDSNISLAKVARTGKAGDVSITSITGLIAVNVQSSIEELLNKITGLDGAAKANSEDQLGNFGVLTGVVEVGGVVQSVDNNDNTKSKQVILKKLAKTASTDDLIQGETIILECGDSSNGFPV